MSRGLTMNWRWSATTYSPSAVGTRPTASFPLSNGGHPEPQSGYLMNRSTSPDMDLQAESSATVSMHLAVRLKAPLRQWNLQPLFPNRAVFCLLVLALGLSAGCGGAGR